MVCWDDGQHWDSGLLWDSASPLPPPVVAANHKLKTTMKRQRFFPRTIAARPDWFGNFATQISIANATLGLPAADVKTTDLKLGMGKCDARERRHSCH